MQEQAPRPETDARQLPRRAACALLLTLATGAAAAPVSARQDDGEAESHFQRALSLKEAKKYEEALGEVRAALRLAPGHNAYLFQAADICTKRKDYAQAVAYFRELTRRYPDIPHNYAHAGINAYWGHDHLTAERFLRMAARRDRAAMGEELYDRAARYLADLREGRRYRITWELQPKPALLEGGRLRVALPSTGLPYQSAGPYEVKGARSHAERRDAAGNRELLLEPDGSARILVTAEVTCRPYSVGPFAAREAPGPYPQEAAAYLSRSLFADPESARVREIARGLKGAGTVETVRNVIRWLDRNLSYRLVGYDSVDKILDSGSVACEGYSSLFVSLCRACGVPARDVWGVAHPAASGRLNGHAWSEFYLNGVGWFPVDATPQSKDDCPGPDYVRMGSYATAGEFRLWRNMVDANVGPSTAATTPTYEYLTPAGARDIVPTPPGR